MLAAMDPAPVALNEQLPESLESFQLLCSVCRRWLLYQRQEHPSRTSPSGILGPERQHEQARPAGVRRGVP